MWFVYALLTVIAWGTADLFYKKGADSEERYSHLKTAITVGFVMGIHAIVTLLTKKTDFSPRNLLIYLPVSAMYILSMTVGYFGLRYLELSISSPIQNSSGAVTCLLCLAVLGQKMSALSAVGVACICLGVFALGVLEKGRQPALQTADEKYRTGLKAFLMPVLYCVIDAIGTFLDAFYLDDAAATPLVGVTQENIEDVANLSYEFTFLLAAVVLLIYVRFIKKEKIGVLQHKSRCFAAVFEMAGQAVYVYAMSGNGAVAAPMIASYSIVSLLLSRLFLKEKLTAAQYVVVAVVMAGIALLGLSEGLAE